MNLLASLPRDLTLVGASASLEPLQIEQVSQLIDAASDGELWNLHFTSVPTPQTTEAYVREALDNQAAGQQHPFAIRRISDGKIVGCTRYYEIQQQHLNLAIGYTWYAKSAQRTSINTECKLMLLTHAFEQLNCISVMFHTDDQNIISQTAIARLGATKDGVLRNHKIVANGRYRHTWQYSIIESEWPKIKQNLSDRLNWN